MKTRYPIGRDLHTLLQAHNISRCFYQQTSLFAPRSLAFALYDARLLLLLTLNTHSDAFDTLGTFGSAPHTFLWLH